jgi:hypothetical protein
MVYDIKQYSFDKAKQLGVTIKPSTKKGKKIDVFKGDDKVASVGALGMKDFPTYVEEKGLDFAQNRRRLYRIRHNKNIYKKDSPGFYASRLLW